MVHYTPLSYDDIYPVEAEQNTLITYGGKSLYVKKDELGDLQLVQLLSTDPQDFLNVKFSPGTTLSNEYIQQMK